LALIRDESGTVEKGMLLIVHEIEVEINQLVANAFAWG
jgi:hypothetical protein